MPTGVYDHSNNKGFTGKKHSLLTKIRMGESHARIWAQKFADKHEKHTKEEFINWETQ